MNQKEPADQHNAREAKRRMEDALKRALTTPHKPHKPKAGDSKAASKPRRKKES